jgi:sugar/nucleoside kinase (ribokinase family)
VPYERLGRRLADAPSPTLSTLPDGSVDRYCQLSAGAVGPLETREALGRELLRGDHSSFHIRVESTEPGGQAVNAAQQLHALGSEVTCYGHLDAPVFAQLPFETVSMGEPALVDAFNFRDSDVMFVEQAGLPTWTLEDLRDVATLPAVFDVDAVCCSNWISFPHMGEAFHRLGTMDLPRVPFVFDPGDIVGSTPEEVDALHDALTALQRTFDVVLNANRQEVGALAGTLDAGADDADRLAAIRSATGIEAAVMHAPEEAIAVTTTQRARVENCPVDQPRRHTGGGDHFTGGVGYALANGWDWDLALACGNVCASHYVTAGETGTVEDVRRVSRTTADT